MEFFNRRCCHSATIEFDCIKCASGVELFERWHSFTPLIFCGSVQDKSEINYPDGSSNERKFCFWRFGQTRFNMFLNGSSRVDARLVLLVFRLREA
ncbi:hypothetical protein CEXT_196851 [Caerostris extrusa]|uniref:Uncharacterized protein n=1 Tax=Caerostris extrusa TaxID=172846 RepID=A0AAV4Y6R0_CAEEX|nr:hypothetical protein CEXT_196851 [Caerostris extrusa]